MDTRQKIVDASQAAAIVAAGATVVSGYFDPLLASQAARLVELKPKGKKLLVLIADPKNPILPTAARAQLVASLAVVDYVTELTGPAPYIHLEQEHAASLANLLEHLRPCVS
jgi:hypothetical protein